MTLPDYSVHFAQYIKDWIKKNEETIVAKGEYESIGKYIEEHGDDLYLEWLEIPADWLDGASPALYFDDFDSVEELFRCALWYLDRNIKIPEPLMESIIKRKDDAIPGAFRLLMDASAAEAKRVFAMELLIELNADFPLNSLMEIIKQQNAISKLTALAIDELCYAGEAAWQWAIEQYENASFFGKLGLVHLLAEPPVHPNALPYAVALFKQAERETDRSILAQLLGRMEDANAIPALEEAAMRPGISYLEYIDLRNAVDALGGPPLPQRQFTGDPAHDHLSKEPEDV